MKILRIIARLNVGGPARHVVWLNKNLQDDEFQSVLIAGSIPEGESNMDYFATQNKVTPIYVIAGFLARVIELSQHEVEP